MTRLEDHGESDSPALIYSTRAHRTDVCHSRYRDMDLPVSRRTARCHRLSPLLGPVRPAYHVPVEELEAKTATYWCGAHMVTVKIFPHCLFWQVVRHAVKITYGEILYLQHESLRESLFIGDSVVVILSLYLYGRGRRLETLLFLLAPSNLRIAHVVKRHRRLIVQWRRYYC